MPEPLVPLGGYLDFAIVGGGLILHDSAHAILVRGECIAELPECISLKVKTYERSVSVRLC